MKWCGWTSKGHRKEQHEVEKLKKDLVSQNKYVASLELELGRVKKASKQQKSDIEDLQVNLDELEQYTRKNSFEFHGIVKLIV